MFWYFCFIFGDEEVFVYVVNFGNGILVWGIFYLLFVNFFMFLCCFFGVNVLWVVWFSIFEVFIFDFWLFCCIYVLELGYVIFGSDLNFFLNCYLWFFYFYGRCLFGIIEFVYCGWCCCILRFKYCCLCLLGYKVFVLFFDYLLYCLGIYELILFCKDLFYRCGIFCRGVCFFFNIFRIMLF